ncbi:MAG: conjugal transfer protein TraN [Bacillota bacterium]|nr:conjugal transfer protein TraN [Bacillota bacterium]
MRIGFFLLIINSHILLISSASAMYKNEAIQRQKSAMNTAKSTSPTVIPGFASPSPPEVQFNNPHSLEGSSQNVFLHNETAKMLKRTAETRSYFPIDLNSDPLIKHSNESVGDPEKVLRSGISSKKLNANYVIKTCREVKPPIEFRCSKNLVPPTVHVDPAKYSNYWCSKGNHRPDDPKCGAKTYYTIPRMYEAEKVHVSPEVWTSDCGTMGTETQNRSCRLVSETCLGGAETRTVISTVGPQRIPTPHQVTRPCWRYEYLYACAYPSMNNCGALKNSGCEQIQSTCLNEFGGNCIEWEQTYRCPTHGGDKREQASQAGFTLSPEEPAPEAVPNGDMSEALAKLYVLKDIQDDLRVNEKANINAIQIFKGDSRKCTIAFANFKNCCTDGKGWGVSLNLSGCDGEDKDLAKRQRSGLCVSLGTYCAEKFAGVCIRKKKSHCCFPTKLARILHEQGRPQLKLGWGEAEHPQCRGFTVDELSRLDFDKLDLRELFAEIAAKAHAITQRTVNVVGRNLSERVNQMTHGFKPSQPTNKPKSGDF